MFLTEIISNLIIKVNKYKKFQKHLSNSFKILNWIFILSNQNEYYFFSLIYQF